MDHLTQTLFAVIAIYLVSRFLVSLFQGNQFLGPERSPDLDELIKRKKILFQSLLPDQNQDNILLSPYSKEDSLPKRYHEARELFEELSYGGKKYFKTLTGSINNKIMTTVDPIELTSFIQKTFSHADNLQTFTQIKSYCDNFFFIKYLFSDIVQESKTASKYLKNYLKKEASSEVNPETLLRSLSYFFHYFISENKSSSLKKALAPRRPNNDRLKSLSSQERNDIFHTLCLSGENDSLKFSVFLTSLRKNYEYLKPLVVLKKLPSDQELAKKLCLDFFSLSQKYSENDYKKSLRQKLKSYHPDQIGIEKYPKKFHQSILDNFNQVSLYGNFLKKA